MDCLLEPIQCTKCFEQLKNPVVLPCGNAICKKHQEESQNLGDASIYCSVCDLHHVIPNDGFVRNLALEKLIERKIDSIEMGDEYDWAYGNLEGFSDLFDRFEKLKKDPDEKIYTIISELKSEIDLRREELKNKIDEEALSIIKQLDEYEAECKANIASFKAEIENNEKLNEWKEDLDRWRQQMITFKKDIDMWKKIQEESTSKYDEMETAFNKFYKDLFLNRFDDYNDLKLLIGNDSDMIKNHSITYVVKNLAQKMRSEEGEEDIHLYSETFRAFGLDWCLGVGTLTSTDENSGDAIKYVGIYLYAKGNYTKETCDVSFDIMILHRTDPSKNIKDNLEYTYIDSVGWGEDSIIKLNDLINNDGFFDAENDCFTVQVIIKSVEFKSIVDDRT